MRSPLAESQRDALIEAMLPDVAFDGWSRATLRAAARRIGMPVVCVHARTPFIPRWAASVRLSAVSPAPMARATTATVVR